MKKMIGSILLMLGMFCVCVATSSAGTTGDLVSLLVSQLGVTEKQATGGAGAVFKTAQDNLEVDEYATLTNAMPEVKGLVEQAPVVEKKSSGWMSSATSMMGDTGKKADSASLLLDSFESLGLDSDMVSKFTPLIVDYAQENGGDICVKLLNSVL